MPREGLTRSWPVTGSDTPGFSALSLFILHIGGQRCWGKFAENPGGQYSSARKGCNGIYPGDGFCDVCTNTCTVSAGKPLTTEYRCLCFRVCFNQPLWQSGQILPPGVGRVTIPHLRLEASNNSAGKDRGSNRLLTVSGNSRHILMVGYPFTSEKSFSKGLGFSPEHFVSPGESSAGSSDFPKSKVHCLS